MKSFQFRDLAIRYVEAGSGVPVLLAHCSSGSHRQWSALMERLAERYHVVAPDLIGYGESDRWPADRPFDARADADMLVALAERVGGPMHLAGHSYGAAMLVEAARTLGDRVLSLSLVEPVSFHLLAPAGRDREWREVSGVTRAIVDGVRAGRPKKAADAYMGFWVGRIRWRLMPRRSRAAIVDTVDKVAHEFAAVRQVSVNLADYAAIAAPTRLVLGERTRRPARAVTEILHELLPRSEVRVVRGAGHMSPFTHRDQINQLLATHIEQVL